MTREEWLALAERIEKATKPNREIDARISVAVGAVVMWFSKVTGKWAFWTTPVDPNPSAAFPNVVLSFNKDDAFRALGEYTIAPHYTGSLDAITALIEREFPDRLWTVLRFAFGAKAAIDPTLGTVIFADAETPALALCAVFCRAMAERD
jgi:hypothetical protein